MSVAFEQPPTLDLGEPTEPLELEEFGGALELGEVLLDPRVGQARELLGPQALDGRAQLAHRSLGSSLSNIHSTLERTDARVCDRHHGFERLQACGSAPPASASRVTGGQPASREG
jgi:hypothetical protein